MCELSQNSHLITLHNQIVLTIFFMHVLQKDYFGAVFTSLASHAVCSKEMNNRFCSIYTLARKSNKPSRYWSMVY